MQFSNQNGSLYRTTSLKFPFKWQGVSRSAKDIWKQALAVSKANPMFEIFSKISLTGIIVSSPDSVCL
jgi:hypothetical protein